MKESQIIKEIPLANTESGIITIATVREPYGEESEPVVSVGIWLNKSSDEPDWKVHIPVDSLDEVIAALQEAKRTL
ncbi:hypothetical protein [Hydrogenimonas sp.]|uniref:hypothetical protein n=1 Tax=Hydrogenimonas sp. TaxID=2231112 RepID=UPI00261E32FA|nr:hypothetical protein [Hydrogenimonas sp.]